MTNPKRLGVKGNHNPEALRRTGWRGPLLDGRYQDLVFILFGTRPEFKGATTRQVVEAALTAFATKQELQDAGLLVTELEPPPESGL